MKPFAPDFDRTSHRGAVAILTAILLVVPFPAARVAGAMLVVGILPGLAVSGARRFSREAALGIALALAPVVFGGLVLMGLLASMPMPVAAAIAAAAGLGLFVVAGRAVPDSKPADRTAWRGLWIVLGVAALLAFALPLADTWWRVRSDSWFHAAVADKLARDGLPVMDPYFAGFRLQYMYFYHCLLAGCAALARVDYFHAMIMLNAVALAACGWSFYALAGEFTRRAGPRIAGLCVWLFSMNGWFYLFYPIRIARALTGASHGSAQLRAFFPWHPFGHDTAVQLISVEGNQFMFLDKFMLGTAFSLALAPATILLLLIVKARLGMWSRRHDAAFILCVSGGTLLHVVSGVTVVIATLLVLGLLLVARAQPSPGGPSYARLAAWVCAGLAVALPFLMSMLPHGGGTGGPAIAFALQPPVALGVFADVMPALVLGLVFLRGWKTQRDHDGLLGARFFSEMSLSATGMLALWSVAVAVIALTVDLVTNNETKFAFLLLLPLSAFAAGGLAQMWEQPRSRRVAIALVVSATIPLHALYYYHAVRDASVFALTTGERAAYDWISKQTPRDAVFIDERDTVHIPVLASRDLYWGTEAYARNWGYDPGEMTARKRLRDDLYSPRGLDAGEWLRLRALGRPVFAVYRTKLDEFTDDSERFLAFPGFKGRFTAERVTVFELDPEAR